MPPNLTATLQPLNGPCRRANSNLERGLPSGPVLGMGLAPEGATGAGGGAGGGADGAADGVGVAAAAPLPKAPCCRASSNLESGLPPEAGAEGFTVAGCAAGADGAEGAGGVAAGGAFADPAAPCIRANSSLERGRPPSWATVAGVAGTVDAAGGVTTDLPAAPCCRACSNLDRGLLAEAAAAVAGEEEGTALAGSDLAAGETLAALGEGDSGTFSVGFAVAVFLALPSTILR